MMASDEAFSRSEPAPAWRYRIRYAERWYDPATHRHLGQLHYREGELHAHTQLRAMWLLSLLVQRRWIAPPIEAMPVDYQVWRSE